MGFCDSAPVASINAQIHHNLTPPHLTQLIKTELHAAQSPPCSLGRIEKRLGQPRLKHYLASGGYAVYERLLHDGDSNCVIGKLDACGLRGLGGAGFKTGLKWRMVHDAKDGEKIVVCNAEEGEPGSFKDRSLLTFNPHLILEALLIASWTVGASTAYIYLRREYVEPQLILEKCLDQLQRRGMIGRNIRGSGFNLKVKLVVGAGSYIAGEETALLESLEGNRCEPRLRPPYPATYGLWGKPTLIQNVETLSCIPGILQSDESQSKPLGEDAGDQWKLYSVSGCVKRSGVYKLPLGVTARELICEHAGGPWEGREVKAFFPGGIAGGFLPGSRMDVPLDFESLSKHGCSLGTGGVIVVDEGSCIIDVVENCLQFFARESCGKCTPCRMGTARQLAIIQAIKRGTAELEDITCLRELGSVMNDASICGLGHTAHNPVRCGLEFFEKEFLNHLHGRCTTGVCQAGVG